jgi:hypothetical protein
MGSFLGTIASNRRLFGHLNEDHGAVLKVNEIPPLRIRR